MAILFSDAYRASSRSPEESIDHTLNEDPKVTITLRISADNSHITELKAAAEQLRKRDNVLDHFGRLKEPLQTILKFGNAVSELHPIAKAVVGCIEAVHEILEEQEQYHDIILKLADSMARTIDYVADVEQFARLVQLVKAIEELKVLVEETEVFIRKYCNRDELVHALRSVVSSSIHEKVDELNQRFDRFTRQFDRGVNVQSAITVDLILKKLVSKEGDVILASLEPKDVNRNLLVGRCMKGTREGPLREIATWTEDLNAPNILWLKGHPDVGKSAMAASIIHRLRENRRLGSQFIFRRQESNVSMPHALWRSVAFDLSQQYPGIRQKIIGELDADPHLIKTDESEELFEKLVYAPLAGMEGVPDGRLPVIVIDGLDECGGLDGKKFPTSQRSSHYFIKMA